MLTSQSDLGIAPAGRRARKAAKPTAKSSYDRAEIMRAAWEKHRELTAIYQANVARAEIATASQVLNKRAVGFVVTDEIQAEMLRVNLLRHAPHKPNFGWSLKLTWNDARPKMNAHDRIIAGIASFGNE